MVEKITDCKNENNQEEYGPKYTGGKGLCYPEGSDTVFQMNLYTPNEDGSSRCHENATVPSPATDNDVYLNVTNYGFDRELKLNFCNKRQIFVEGADPILVGFWCNNIEDEVVTGPTSCAADAGDVGSYCAQFTDENAYTFATGDDEPTWVGELGEWNQE